MYTSSTKSNHQNLHIHIHKSNFIIPKSYIYINNTNTSRFENNLLERLIRKTQRRWTTNNYLTRGSLLRNFDPRIYFVDIHLKLHIPKAFAHLIPPTLSIILFSPSIATACVSLFHGARAVAPSLERNTFY